MLSFLFAIAFACIFIINLMRKSKIISRFLLILFLGSLTMALNIGHYSSLLAGVPAKTAFKTQKSAIAFAEKKSPREIVATKEQAAPKQCEERENREGQLRNSRETGQWRTVINWLDRAIICHQDRGNWQKVGHLQREQADAYNHLGQYPQAIALLCKWEEDKEDGDILPPCTENSSIAIARDFNNVMGEAAAWESLAETYRLNSHYNRAMLAVAKAEELYQSRCEVENSECVLFQNLFLIAGKTYSDRGERYQQRARSAKKRKAEGSVAKFRQRADSDRRSALEKLTQSEKLASLRKDIFGQMQALFEIFRLVSLSSMEEPSEARAKILALLPQLPPSERKFTIAFGLARLAAQPPVLTPYECRDRLLGQEQSRELLAEAFNIAQFLQNDWLQSFALGELGHIEECANNFSLALDYTRHAKRLVQNSYESLYFWQWQVGRIYQRRGNQEDRGRSAYESKRVLNAYKSAIASLSQLRHRIDFYPRDWQFDFRDLIDPLYREYLHLLLKNLPSEGEERRQVFALVREKLEVLHIAELKDYLGQKYRLVQHQNERIAAQKHTAIFYSIFFADEVAIAVEFPDRSLELQWWDTEDFQQKIWAFREEITARDNLEEPKYLAAQKLYHYIIEPFTSRLQEAEIETLVFIQDGILNNIPMAALHDGEKFLVKDYAIAMTPALFLTQPQGGNFRNFDILAFGLTQKAIVDGQEFDPLEAVEEEVKAITTEERGFFDLDFSADRLQQELDRHDYSILHLATHAQFGTVSDDTFLVTGAIDPDRPQDGQKLTLARLENIFQQLSHKGKLPQLLVLSACQTATGDDRFTLGLGGIALKSGIPTTVASLWSIRDKKTQEFIVRFYQHLEQDKNPVIALKEAQKEEIELKIHPAHWAAFIAIGNWL